MEGDVVTEGTVEIYGVCFLLEDCEHDVGVAYGGGRLRRGHDSVVNANVCVDFVLF